MAATPQGRYILHQQGSEPTSGHLSEATRTKSTEEFRQYNEARKSRG
jgi:hypothetical protein